MPQLQTNKIYRILSRALSEGYRVVSAQGSSRSGKTYNILLWLMTYLLEHRGLRLSIVRSTLPALKGSVLVDFKEILIALELWDERAFNKSDLIYTLPSGSVVEFFSCDSEQKLRGRKRDILFVNEANELRELEWQQLRMRTSRFSILDYNPSFSDDHWLCALNHEPETYHFVTTFRDNPFLPPAIVEHLLSLKEKNPALWRIYGEGQQAQLEGLIYPHYTLIDQLPQGLKHWRVGLDFGFTHDPTAAVRVGFTPEALYLDELIYQPGLFAPDIARLLQQEAPHHRIIADSAEPRTIAELVRLGLDVHAVSKGRDSVLSGIAKVQTMQLYVTRRSTNLIKELRNYTWRQRADGRWLDEPVDAFNHALDALRYVVLSELMDKRPRGHINRRKLARLAY